MTALRRRQESVPGTWATVSALGLTVLAWLKPIFGRRTVGAATSVVMHGGLAAAFFLHFTAAASRVGSVQSADEPSVSITLVHSGALERTAPAPPQTAATAAAAIGSAARRASLPLQGAGDAQALVAAAQAPGSADAEALANPAPPAGGAATGSTSAANASTAAIVSDYRDRLQAYLEQHRRPNASGGAGAVRLAVSLDRHGVVLAARVDGSSGQKALDDEALAMIWRVQPLPSIPPELPDHLTVRLPVIFTPYQD
jgi:TonB family protein